MKPASKQTFPEPFDFTKPEDWPRWIRIFEKYRETTSLHEQTTEKQIEALTYAMGEPAKQIMASFSFGEAASKKSYIEVLEKFQSYFKHSVVPRKVIFERAKFNQRKQEPGESVESFISSLFSLVEQCAYGYLQEQVIRDRIIVGIRDQKLSERLRLDYRLKLATVIDIVRKSEHRRRRFMSEGAVEDSLSENLASSSDRRSALKSAKTDQSTKPKQVFFQEYEFRRW